MMGTSGRRNSSEHLPNRLAAYLAGPVCLAEEISMQRREQFVDALRISDLAGLPASCISDISFGQHSQ